MNKNSIAPTSLRVFLCHSSGDKESVKTLYQKLRGDGFDPWLDSENIDPGQRWDLEIPRALRKSHVVLVCLSKTSVNKEGYVQKEIKFALDKADELPEDTIFIIPLRLEECQVPERLSAWQWVDYFDDNGYEKLKRSLNRRAGSLELPQNSKDHQQIQLSNISSQKITDLEQNPFNIDRFLPSDDLLPEEKSSKNPINTVTKIKENERHFAAAPQLALIMKGGGVKGLAYVGALKELEKHFDFNWFVGTSAGAIAAVLLAAGYTADELEKILSNKNFLDFLDKKWTAPLKLIIHGGLFEARSFTVWLDKLLKEKIKSFGPLRLEKLKKRATVYASRRYQKALIFDSQSTRKETSASFAVRCSMSIPFVFTPQRDQGLRVLDGGMQNNYPVGELLEGNPGTKFIGLYLGNHYEGMPKEPSLLSDMLHIWTEAVDAEAVEKFEKETIIIDPRPISTIDFNLTEVEKAFLLKAGQAAALRWLSDRNLPDGPLPSDAEDAEKELNALRTEVENNRQYRRTIGRVGTVLVLALVIISSYFLFKRLTSPAPNISSPTQDNSVNSNKSSTDPNLYPGMALVTGGEFLMGRNDAKIIDEKPAHSVTVYSFYMDKYEVTNKQYFEFVKSTNHKPPSMWRKGVYPISEANFPVVGVDWEDANDFCKYAGKRLPTEEEWEFAARGPNNYKYPWGNEWKENQANLESNFLTSGGSFTEPSPFGIYDLIGNAFEWTASDFKAYPGGELDTDYAGKTNLKTLRGGSFRVKKGVVTASYRLGLAATGERYDNTGLRCVKDTE